MKIKINELRELITKALDTKFDEEHSRIIAEVILFGEISGKKSHGINRIFEGKYAIVGRDCPKAPEIIKKTNVSIQIKGNNNPGMLVASIAMKKAIELAKENGIGIVGANESFQTSGALIYYLKQIAEQDLIGIMMARAPPDIAPYGGYEALFGTNPMSFAIPANPEPLFLDMGMSTLTFGDLLNAKTSNKKIPEKMALDSKGNPTTDPSEAMKGSILSFDRSYKGTGLAMMVEILSGAWTGADFCQLDESKGWGNLFIVMSPELLSNLDEFKQNVHDLIERVRNSKTKENSKIRIPGEKTLNTYNKSLKQGWLEIDDQLIKRLEEIK